MQNYLTMIRRARSIKQNLGIKAAAGYLRNQGVSLEGALSILVYTKKH
jgi:hypothetical protein